jgi:Tfp pilus assembly protein PilN
MKVQRAGLLLHDHYLTVVAVKRDRLEHFTLEASDNPASLLAAELKKRGVRTRRLRVGLDRSLVMVKALELPPAVGKNLHDMVRFEVERQVPFPSEEIRFDFVPLLSQQHEPPQILMLAAERRTVERALRLVAEIPRRPIALTPACHDLRTLLPRRLATQRAIWAHRHGDHTDLLFIAHGQIHLSRRVEVTDGAQLAIAIQRTYWGHTEVLWISGDDSVKYLSSPELAGLCRVSAPPYRPSAAMLVRSLPEEGRGAAILALAVANGSHQPTLNLLPPETRPWTLSRGHLVTMAMGSIATLMCFTLLFSFGYKKQRYLRHLSNEISRLEPEVKAVDRLFSAAAEKKRLAAALDTVRAGGVRPLQVLRELTDILPPDAWMQSLSLDSQGLEITGQSGAASQLIPLLEKSPLLERVEFSSPVTRNQDKDQFRMKAAWEGAATQPPGPRPVIGGQQ